MVVLAVVFAVGCNESPTELESLFTPQFAKGGNPGGPGGGGPDYLATITSITPPPPDTGAPDDDIPGVECPADKAGSVALDLGCLPEPDGSFDIGEVTMVGHSLLVGNPPGGSKEIVALKIRLIDAAGTKYRSADFLVEDSIKLDRKSRDPQVLLVRAANIPICRADGWSLDNPCLETIGEARIGDITYVKP
jgi:hypothetical protein